MTKHFTHTIPIKFYHLDVQHQLSLPALVNLLFEASGYHAEANGFGMSTINAKGISWIVGRVGIYMARPLTHLPSCTIETWIDRTMGPSTLRKFNLYNPHNQCIATACFTYAALNLNTRQPVNVKEIIGNELTDTEYGKAIPMPAKIKPVIAKPEIFPSFPVKYGDLDYNRHATTTKYLQWILDTFPMERHQEYAIKKMEVNFASELFYQDVVTPQTAAIQQDEYVVELTAKDKVACRAKICWEKKIS